MLLAEANKEWGPPENRKTIENFLNSTIKKPCGVMPKGLNKFSIGFPHKRAPFFVMSLCHDGQLLAIITGEQLSTCKNRMNVVDLLMIAIRKDCMRQICTSISVITFFLSAIATPSCADVIRLKNGSTIEGIILDNQEHSVTIEVNIGEITFSKDDIESIEKSTSQENKALKASWQKEKGQTTAYTKHTVSRKEKTSEKTGATKQKDTPSMAY